MNGILLRLKIDPAAVQSSRGSNALQAVQTLFGISLNSILFLRSSFSPLRSKSGLHRAVLHAFYVMAL